jgi:hypothetical protein
MTERPPPERSSIERPAIQGTLRCGAVTAVVLGLLLALQLLPLWADVFQSDRPSAPAPTLIWRALASDAAILAGFCLCLDLAYSLAAGHYRYALLTVSVVWHILVGRFLALPWAEAFAAIPAWSDAVRTLGSVPDHEIAVFDFRSLNVLLFAIVLPPLLAWTKVSPWQFPVQDSRASGRILQWSLASWLSATTLLAIALLLLRRMPLELRGFYVWTLPVIGLFAAIYLGLRSTWSGGTIKRLVTALLVIAAAFVLPRLAPEICGGLTELLLLFAGMSILAFAAGTLDWLIFGSVPAGSTDSSGARSP